MPTRRPESPRSNLKAFTSIRRLACWKRLIRRVYKTAPAGPDQVKYDVYGSTSGIQCVSNHICRNDSHEFVKSTESKTDDALITIRQTFTVSQERHPSDHSNGDHQLSQGESVDLTDFLVKRYADIEVDTGGRAGWAGFQGIGTKLATRSSLTISTAMRRRVNELTSSIWWRCLATWFWTIPSSEDRE